MSENKRNVRCVNCGTENEYDLSQDKLFCKECGNDLTKYIKEENNIVQNQNNTTSSQDSIISSIGQTVLTKDYILKSYSMIGKEFSMYIFLKDISSIKLDYNSFPILILLAVISFIGGFVANDSGCIIAGIIIGLIFIAAFFLTRKRVIEISAHNSKRIIEAINGFGDNAQEFINKVVEAKKAIK